MGPHDVRRAIAGVAEASVQPLPHRYHVTASADSDGEVSLVAPGLPPLRSAPPSEFGGPGDLWSPETLLLAAVVDCFVLTFRAVARASSIPWRELRCDADGTLDRVERVTRFTAIELRAELVVPPEVPVDRAERALQRAERGCLVSNSLVFRPILAATVRAG